MLFDNLSIFQMLLPLIIFALLVIFFILPICKITKISQNNKKQRKEELQLLREQNELLKQLANNKGE